MSVSCMRGPKGQLSLEFMVAASVMLGFLVMLAIIIAGVQAGLLGQDRTLRMQADCATLASAIDGAVANPGIIASVSLSHNATVHALPRIIEVGDVVCTIPVSAVSNGSQGTFNLETGPVKVWGAGDGVVVRNG
jgi:hypothetical protein